MGSLILHLCSRVCSARRRQESPVPPGCGSDVAAGTGTGVTGVPGAGVAAGTGTGVTGVTGVGVEAGTGTGVTGVTGAGVEAGNGGS